MAVLGRRLTVEARVRYAHVREIDAARARIVVVPFLTPGVTGMTLGRWVLIRRGHEADAGLMAHELVHVEQWREHGAVRFLCRYVGTYLQARRAGLPHWDAYHAIPFEREARARSGA